MQLAGKVALVTGAGRGIGRAIAEAYAREGAAVAVNYAHSAEAATEVMQSILAAGGRAIAVQADVSRADEVRAMVERTVGTFGTLDILVNNAAVFSSKPIFDVSEQLWDRVVGTNLKGTFLCCQAAARTMIEHGGGCIINFSSGGGTTPWPKYDVSVAYAASKAGVIMLTQRLAIELGPSIRVNCIVPGMIDSKPEPFDEATRRRFAELAPLKRVGVPADFGGICVFLASPAADFITGEVIGVDGGLH